MFFVGGFLGGGLHTQVFINSILSLSVFTLSLFLAPLNIDTHMHTHRHSHMHAINCLDSDHIFRSVFLCRNSEVLVTM